MDCNTIIVENCYNKEVARYDMVDSIPGFLYDANIESISINDCGTVTLVTDFGSVLDALDYVEEQVRQTREAIADDEYHYDSPEAIKKAVETLMGDLSYDCAKIRNDLQNGEEWNYRI